MAKMIDIDFVVKGFFDSVIKWLVARQPRTVVEQEKIARAIARLKLMATDPKKYTEWTELFSNYDDLVGLGIPGKKWGQYDNAVYVAVASVLGDLCEYYKTPNDYYTQCLENSIQKYYVAVTSNIFQKLSYKLMSPTAVMQKLSNQKLK